MPLKIVECVPNISEGRDPAIIRRLAEAVRSVPGVHLLHLDMSADANRTVFTFAGPPDEVGEAAYRLIAGAGELIDMRTHSGAHPRIGATDVCPFVPLHGVTLAECVELSRSVAAKVAGQLGIPTYLYEASAQIPERSNLANIRRGEYESLPARMLTREWQPDFPAKKGFNAKSGATVIGARRILIAYNITLNTDREEVAQEVARRMRSERKRDPRLKGHRAIGWFMRGYDRAQVSINVIDYHVTGLHDVFETCRRHAAELGFQPLGSELIGLLPRKALAEVGAFYAGRRVEEIAASHEALFAAAHQLGLSFHRPFVVGERVLDIRLREAFQEEIELTN